MKITMVKNKALNKRDKSNTGVWVMSASKVYDHQASFKRFGAIDWANNVNFEVGDIVYIYCTFPASEIRYKCVVDIVNVSPTQRFQDGKFWLNQQAHIKNEGPFKKYTRLKLVGQAQASGLELSALKKMGLKAAPQGPVRIDQSLHRYINRYFQTKPVTAPVTVNSAPPAKAQTNYVNQRVHHVFPKFGEGIVIDQGEDRVTVKFDNGITTSFLLESFSKNLLKLSAA